MKRKYSQIRLSPNVGQDSPSVALVPAAGSAKPGASVEEKSKKAKGEATLQHIFGKALVTSGID